MTPHTPATIALVGVGKIARDQHIPSIAGNPGLRLAAAASRSARVDGVENFRTLEEMLAAMPDLDAVALCTPPQVRYAMARTALMAGKHVLLEKPPGVTLSEVEALRGLADDQRRTLFATWHSRFAAAVEPARAWLADKTVRRAEMVWKEDVRHWHPGQSWIWTAGGLGVFDPGINGLSILTRIMPRDVFLTAADMAFPENCETPIAADLSFADAGGAAIRAELDWRRTGEQCWNITVETDAGTLKLSQGGSVLAVDGTVQAVGEASEYAGIYQRFTELIRQGASEVDTAPLRQVADAFMLARRVTVEAFEE